jgi:hypothetical protein
VPAAALLQWLAVSGIGPAVVALPVNWTADALAGVAQHWFRRLRRSDDLSRIVKAATGTSVSLDRAEFAEVRRLLEDEQTWRLLRHGTVEDLAARIASSLRPRDGLTSEDANAAALAIARGLLEFAVADLEPKVFQQVLMARLERLETARATAFDEAVLAMQADLAMRLEAQGHLDAQRSAVLFGQLKRVLDQLPTGPADRGEVVIYLRTLIAWLNTDPWPRWLGQSALTPAVIERKLLAAKQGREKGLDTDELTHRCQRLVMLGGPGSGKTWLARRAARKCAEAALEALIAGADADEVELPLFTTCSRLVSASGGIRQVIASSALEQIGDLGGSRITEALRHFFAERNAPTFLVIDSLDEAHNADDRLRQADSLPENWRLFLTSRPESWHGQVSVNQNNPAHCIGELQPLRYPVDVESFIRLWFTRCPDLGNRLIVQLKHRRGLQQPATVPLILTYYCILGGSEPLPEFRRLLYRRVLNRMLTGFWRGSGDRRSRPDACLQTLRAWAWSGATSDPASGVGTWANDIWVQDAPLDGPERDAVDHVATPLDLPDVDTSQTLRRFIHRSLREHLVAEHVASLPTDQAVEALLPHLWYDADWEYAAPAALAMHPKRDRVLQEVIRRAAGSEGVPDDLSLINLGCEFPGFLARVAEESGENDWSPETAQIIGQARVQLITTLHIGELSRLTDRQHRAILEGPGDIGIDHSHRTGHWETSDRQACEALVELVANQADGSTAAYQAEMLAQLAPTADDSRQARGTLLKLLAHETDGSVAVRLACAVAQLGPGPEDRLRARQSLLKVLADGGQADQLGDWLVQLAPTSGDKREARGALLELMPGQENGWVAAQLANALIRLGPAPDDRRQALHALLALLAKANLRAPASLMNAIAEFASTRAINADVRSELLTLLARATDGRIAALVSETLLLLGPVAEEKDQARRALLRLLTHDADGSAAKDLMVWLTQADAGIHPAREALAQQAQLQLMTGQADSTAARLVRVITQLDPTTEDKCQARDALMLSLAREAHEQLAPKAADWMYQIHPAAGDNREAESRKALEAEAVAKGVVALIGAPSPQGIGDHDASRALLAGSVARELVSGIIKLDLPPDEKRETRRKLLSLLAGSAGERMHSFGADALVSGLLELATSADEQREASRELLSLLRQETNGHVARLLAIGIVHLATGRTGDKDIRALLDDLISGVTQVALTPEEMRDARQTILGLLDRETNGRTAALLAAAQVFFEPTAEDIRHARQVLLRLLADDTDGPAAQVLVGVIQICPTSEDVRVARQALLRLLTHSTHSQVACEIATGLLQLGPVAEEKRTARQALLRLLTGETDGQLAVRLTLTLEPLDATSHDKHEARQALHQLLIRTASADTTWWARSPDVRDLMTAVVPLATTTTEKQETRQVVLRLLARENGDADVATASVLVHGLEHLEPTLQDLSAWHTWAIPPSTELLTSVRRVSALDEWLKALPSLRQLSL